MDYVYTFQPSDKTHNQLVQTNQSKSGLPSNKYHTTTAHQKTDPQRSIRNLQIKIQHMQ
jgi:hypothetical protein